MQYPIKGAYYEPTISIFKDAGLPISGGAESRKLFAKTTDPDIHILFARAADIPEYVQDGAADVGITGMDLITERGANVETLLDLKFGKASLVLAVPEDSNFQKAQDLEGKKIATEFPEITSQYFEKLGVNVDGYKGQWSLRNDSSCRDCGCNCRYFELRNDSDDQPSKGN